MCGIVGYLGDKNAKDVILSGLKRLEYRGYDSAGISTMHSNIMEVTKIKGKVDELLASIPDDSHNGSIGIGHTRWATHGVPNEINAHPQVNQNKRIAELNQCVFRLDERHLRHVLKLAEKALKEQESMLKDDEKEKLRRQTIGPSLRLKQLFTGRT